METALLSVSELLQATQATCLSSGLILLNLSASFDTVAHSSSCPPCQQWGSVAQPWTGLSPTSLVAPSRFPGLVQHRHLSPLPQEFPRAQSLACFFSPFILNPLALLLFFMVCLTTARLMTPNYFSSSQHLIHRFQPTSLLAWVTSRSKARSRYFFYIQYSVLQNCLNMINMHNCEKQLLDIAPKTANYPTN